MILKETETGICSYEHDSAFKLSTLGINLKFINIGNNYIVGFKVDNSGLL